MQVEAQVKVDDAVGEEVMIEQAAVVQRLFLDQDRLDLPVQVIKPSEGSKSSRPVRRF